MIALYPIKPRYVERILSGEKIYELRKNLPKQEITNVVIYSTSPKSMVVAYAEVQCIHSSTPKELWELVQKDAGIPKKDYFDYFSSSEKAYAIQLKNVREFNKPIKLSDLSSDLSVPQSFCYLNQSLFQKLKRKKYTEVL